ncbi:cupin domain-containing protein [Agromyces lapidis]|uniref:Cupin domain-containing protein n=1 Tax=Agromyces lapidis TaxID=279574 RepID=A0ABV5SSG9_9MICO|nr:cupin domain-containing protein [Agromyces lapidis]
MNAAEITLSPTMTPPETPRVVSADELRIGSGRTRRFVGLEHGARISYFFVDNEPGEGPDLHWHPYAETWIVLEGIARITVGDTELIARAGDTATAPAGVWHGFKNAGEGRLQLIGIHAAETIVQTWAD